MFEMKNVKKSRASNSPVKQLKQRGDFLLTLVIAVIVVAVITAGAYAVYANLITKNEAKTTSDQVSTIAASLRANFGVNNQYGQVNTAISVQSATIPGDLRIVGTNTAANLYGGTITTVPTLLSGPAGSFDAVTLTFTNVPQNQCSNIVLASQGAGRRITVAATVVKPIDGTVNIATLTGACDVAAPVSIAWDVGRSGS